MKNHKRDCIYKKSPRKFLVIWRNIVWFFFFFKLIIELQNSNDFSIGLRWKNTSEFSSKIIEFIVRLLWQSTTSQWKLSVIKKSHKRFVDWDPIQLHRTTKTPFSHNIFLLILLFFIFIYLFNGWDLKLQNATLNLSHL